MSSPKWNKDTNELIVFLTTISLLLDRLCRRIRTPQIKSNKMQPPAAPAVAAIATVMEDCLTGRSVDKGVKVEQPIV